ncbi:Ig-like domain-containing protein, partial [Marinicella sediminis]
TAAFTAGGVTYTPDADYCNDGSPTDDFSYTVNGGSSATVAVTVTCVDDAPTANDDNATVIEDSVNNSILVLGNDANADGGLLEVTGVTQPGNGTAAFTAGGVTYTPDADYCNDGSPTDDFSYTVNGGSSATVAVTVTCEDDAPVALPDSYAILEDAVTTGLTVLDNDDDVDGDPLVIGSVGSASHGLAQINGTVIDYTPDADYCGNDDFTYTISGGNTVAVNVTVTCVNDQPDFALNNVIHVMVDQAVGLAPQLVACQFDFGPDNEDLVQSVEDFLVNVASDDDNILSAVDVANDGLLSYTFTGNSGEAVIELQMQDDGGTDNGGLDTSVSRNLVIKVHDYIYVDGFEPTICQGN